VGRVHIDRLVLDARTLSDEEADRGPRAVHGAIG
jgi:hypothetical protein